MNECPQCRKVSYRSRYDAKRALRAMEGRGATHESRATGTAGEMRPYPCPAQPHTWHLAHGGAKGGRYA